MEETLKKQNRRTIDTYLQHKNRTLRTRPGKLLLGSTGARLFADYLDPAPGFIGRIDFIHKLNLPGIFTFGNHMVSQPSVYEIHKCQLSV